ncbi:MAG: aminodeoxychorismate synthase component I [Desulfococcaceae bacterium]
MIDPIRNMAGEVTGVRVEPLEGAGDFLDLAARFAASPGTTALISGGEVDSAGHHILATRPWLTFWSRGRHLRVRVGGEILELEADPFEGLRTLLQVFALDDPSLPGPVAAGLFGYLAYDLKDQIEELPRTAVDDLALPHIYLTAPSVLVVQDRKNGKSRLLIPERTGGEEADPDEIRRDFSEALSGPPPKSIPFSGDPNGFTPLVSRPVFVESIRRVREYIAAGDVYQVNMAQRFEMDFTGDPFTLFRKLYELNPAPFFAYVHGGDHHVISTSPERFLRRSGAQVETRPIKGTRPRGATAEADGEMARELAESPKDDAELSMIVDLMRNDLGRVCRETTVRVAEHKRLESYQNVHHLVSVVTGELDPDKDTVDLLQATFPGGSITGCPKVRAMEIIDELEPVRRHVYTGAIGYLSFHDTADLSIAIRTATVLNARILFSVGGGIVFDSDPENEYDETIHKGQTLMAAFRGRENPADGNAWVWMNGSLMPAAHAAVPAGHPGFHYGDGFFETIRVDRGRPKLLDAHLDRFNRAWAELFPGPPPDLNWDRVIARVVARNRLDEAVAAVKIIAARGDRELPPWNHSLIVTARPYVHRLAGREAAGLHLRTYPFPRETPLANHKTLNYLYYRRAGRWAADHKADEALVLNSDGSVSETNTGNLVVIHGRTATLPASNHVLPGVTQGAVTDALAARGYRVESRRIPPEELRTADAVILTNSLMGAVSALSLDDEPLRTRPELLAEISEAVA